ncbi:MAG: DNA cytosine methyltransferase [Pyrinomonadaceae bacterium]
MVDKLTAVSLFSGCGGFDWGAKQTGVEIIWANDIDQHAAAAYSSIFPDVEFVHDDIQNISHFPKADILIGCFPCTGYSIAARRRWGNSLLRDLKSDETNFLYWQFLRALEQVKPRFAFIENVGGMITADNGYFLEEQKFHFRRLRYEAAYARLLASDFGDAQARERVFIVLTSYDMRPYTYTFPNPTHGPKGTKANKVLRDVIGEMEEWPEGEFSEKPFHGHYLTRNRKRGWNQLSYTIVAHADHVPLHPIGEPMRNVGKDAWELQGDLNRRLSWHECVAIQGLPKNILPSGGLEQKYKVVGNAVPPVFGEVLLKPIVEVNPSPRIWRF